jgi:glutamine synthetase
MSPAMDYLRSLLIAINDLGWCAYQADHEDGNAQFEVNFAHTDAVTAADRVIFFRMMAAELARPMNAVATFMAKPFADRTGSGLHAHLHMASRDGVNAFMDPKDQRRMGCSSLAYSFIAELLEHSGAMCAITSPTVNCYRRLGLPAAALPTRSGYTWSPREASFGGNNRTHLVRVAGPGNLEDRSPSAACNPYLALLAYTGLARRALDRGGDPGEPEHGSAYERAPRGRLLPRTLLEALDLLQADAAVLDLLGDLGPEYIKVKSAEAMDAERHVSRAELSRYLTAL